MRWYFNNLSPFVRETSGFLSISEIDLGVYADLEQGSLCDIAQKRNRLTDIENRLVVTKWGRWREGGD